MRRLVDALRSWPRRSRVGLLSGEPGSGRKRAARWLHHRWGADRRFVIVDCALGTDHVQRYLGYPPKFDPGPAGTLVLDGVDQLDQGVLARLHLLGSGPLAVGPRGWALVCTTTDAAADNLMESSTGGLLRTYLQPIRIRVPPLRERRMDIPGLVRALLLELGRKAARNVTSVSSEGLDALAAYTWPENVDELRGALEHALLASPEGERLELADLPASIRLPALSMGFAGLRSLADVERRHILDTLQHLGGHRGDTAAALDIHVNTLCRKLAIYGVGRHRRRRAG